MVHMSEDTRDIIGFIGFILFLVYFIFPFVVCRRLKQIAELLKKK